jgi:hypothetical protein
LVSSGGSRAQPSNFNDQFAQDAFNRSQSQLAGFERQRQGLLNETISNQAGLYNQLNNLGSSAFSNVLDANTQSADRIVKLQEQLPGYISGLLSSQRRYYDNSLANQREFSTNYTGLLGDINASEAARDAAFQQSYLDRFNQFSNDSLNQQRQFATDFTGSLNRFNRQGQRIQRRSNQEALGTQRAYGDAIRDASDARLSSQLSFREAEQRLFDDTYRRQVEQRNRRQLPRPGLRSNQRRRRRFL